MKIKGLLFDLDGTLANTLPLCIKVYKQTFEHYTGRSFTDAEVTSHFGLNEEGILQRVLRPEDWTAGLNYYHELYEKGHAECQEPFAEIQTALKLLKEKGLRLALVTGKGMVTARYTLDYLGLAPYFSAVEAGQPHKIVKAEAIRKILAAWQMEPACAAYIGDADTDILEARAAGVLPLAATWAGTSTIHLLKDIQPYASFQSVESFILWIEQNIDSVQS